MFPNPSCRSLADIHEMDQLLTVSQQEEELRCYLQNLDTSLVPARRTLQVAFAEVQRLLLLRQQVSAPMKNTRIVFTSSFIIVYRSALAGVSDHF